jgi:1,4-alpha-glucan branching enzyme
MLLNCRRHEKHIAYAESHDQALVGDKTIAFWLIDEKTYWKWIDFPRPENNYSYRCARRQWSLADSDCLRYKGLNNFDREMQKLDEQYNLLEDDFIEQLAVHEVMKQLIYRRGPLVFVFNFHPTESYLGLRIPVPDPTSYRVILNTDD